METYSYRTAQLETQWTIEIYNDGIVYILRVFFCRCVTGENHEVQMRSY